MPQSPDFEPLLSDHLVIELSRGIAARYCGLLLRHLGAGVVTIDASGGASDERDPLDAGKKSITLDVALPDGAALLHRLAGRADVLVTDDALPLDYDELSRENPRLVLTSITPGSESDAAGYFVGLNAFAATLLPLVNLPVIGRGQRVEVDGLECLVAAALTVEQDRGAFWPRPSDAVAPLPPFRMEGAAPLSPPPSLGEHNNEVYGGLLCLTDEELARLRLEGIV